MGGDAGTSRVDLASGSAEADPDSLQRSLAALAERAQKLDVSSYESAAPDELATLIAESTRLVDEALLAIRDVEAELGRRASLDPDETSGLESQGLLTDVEHVLERQGGLERVLDLAFVSRLGLGQRRVALATPRLLEDKWDAISECSSAVREISKALSALEIAYALHRGAASCSRYYVSELERSRQIRRVYAQLGRDVHALGEATPENVKTVLRRASAAIAKLAGRDVYVSARVHDRRMLRSIQDRIGQWIRTESGASEDVVGAVRTEGIRLYRDLSNITELLMGVNRRAELVVHDRQVVASTLLGLSSLAPGEAIDVARRCPELADLPGRHPTLDAWIAAARAVPVGELTDVLAAVLASLRADACRTGATPAWGITRPRRGTDRPGRRPPAPDDGGTSGTA